MAFTAKILPANVFSNKECKFLKIRFCVRNVVFSISVDPAYDDFN